jgi:hypothetical protein
MIEASWSASCAGSCRRRARYTWVNDREVTAYLVLRYPMSRVQEEKYLSEASSEEAASRTCVWLSRRRRGAHRYVRPSPRAP